MGKGIAGLLAVALVALALLWQRGEDTSPQPVAVAGAAEAPVLLQHTLRRLDSDEQVALAGYAGQPLLIVNTASRCGFTGQFAGLEELHQRYRSDGLRVLGFSSDDFRQELDDEAEAARVCYINFGVTFDMFAPISVRGSEAHPLFQELARQSGAPGWNFHKYVVDRDGQVIAAFASRVAPDDRRLRAAIEQVL